MGVQAEMIELVLPKDTNTHGSLLGATLVHWMDMAAALAAKKQARCPVVTVAINFLDFIASVRVGDYVQLTATLTRVFEKSMEILVRGEIVNPITNPGTQLCVRGYFTFTGIDENGIAKLLPEYFPKSKFEQDEWTQAGRRRTLKFSLRD
ncbi:acyl-CoA thioesterase [bacterium]|nr:acyl-CoA thioesterase [bacterium]